VPTGTVVGANLPQEAPRRILTIDLEGWVPRSRVQVLHTAFKYPSVFDSEIGRYEYRPYDDAQQRPLARTRVRGLGLILF